MIKQSIIISYKQNDSDRKLNLQRILGYLSILLNDETEIVLVEQDNFSKIDFLNSIPNNKHINHIFLENKGIFNKGWGYNAGVKNSKGNYLIFNDIDVFLKLSQYSSSLKLLEKYDVINPYNKIYFLDKNNSEKFINENHNFNNIDLASQYYLPGVISGGIFMMTKEKFLMLKGLDEECYGYGHEDDIFDTKIRKLQLSIMVINEIAVHLFHNVFKDDIYYSRKSINEKLLTQYIIMRPDEILSKINNFNSFGI